MARKATLLSSLRCQFDGSTIIRTILIIVCGALPVLPLAAFAGFVILGGAELIPKKPAEGLFLLTWGVAGVYGAVSLWLSAFRWINLAVVIGLIVGCIAIIPVTYAALLAGSPDEWLWICAVGPPTTAIAILIEVSRRGLSSFSSAMPTAAWMVFALCVAAIVVSAYSIFA